MTLSPHATLFKSCIEIIQEKKVVVLGHLRPDGDCVGSQIALCRSLRSIGIDAVAVNAHPIPFALKSFLGDTPFYLPEEVPDIHSRIPISVDCADLSRIGNNLSAIFPQPFINIDHHISNTLFATHNILNTQSSATAEILADLLYSLDMPIDATTAQALFLGICTDSGQFLYSSTTAHTFEIISKLVKSGAQPSVIGHHLFQQEPFQKIALLQRFLSTLDLSCKGKICIGKLTDEDYTKTQALREYTEGFVDYTRSISSVAIGAFLDENLSTGTIKVSLRAKDEAYRVDLFAKRYQGGGHACAAGFTTHASLDTFYPVFSQDLIQYITNHSH